MSDRLTIRHAPTAIFASLFPCTLSCYNWLLTAAEMGSKSLRFKPSNCQANYYCQHLALLLLLLSLSLSLSLFFFAFTSASAASTSTGNFTLSFKLCYANSRWNSSTINTIQERGKFCLWAWNGHAVKTSCAPSSSSSSSLAPSSTCACVHCCYSQCKRQHTTNNLDLLSQTWQPKGAWLECLFGSAVQAAQASWAKSAVGSANRLMNARDML